MDYKKIKEQLEQSIQSLKDIKENIGIDSLSNNQKKQPDTKNIIDKGNISSNSYYTSGEILCERSKNNNNQIDGTIFWYDKNKILQCEEKYKNGIRCGETIWYKNNEKFFYGECVNGYKEGEWTLRNDDGYYKTNYLNGQKNGLDQYFNLNNEVIFSGEYREGLRIDDRPLTGEISMKLNIDIIEKLDFIYGCGNWYIIKRMSDDEINKLNDDFPCPVNLNQYNITLNFETNQHPLVCHTDFIDWNFNKFYQYEWFLIKNLEKFTIEDIDLINSYSFFFTGIEQVKNRLGGHNIMDIVKNYYPDLYEGLQNRSPGEFIE